MNVFEKFSKDSRMKNHLKRAAESTPDQRVDNNSFEGDDGDYFMEFVKLNQFETKEKVACTEFQFRLVNCEGQEELAGSMLNVFLMFKDDDYNTIEEVMDRFMQTCQLVGVETKSGDMKAVGEAVKGSIGVCIRGSVVTGKSAKKNKSLYLRGPAEAPGLVESEEGEEEAEEVEVEVVSTDWVAVGAAAEEGDEEAQALLLENCPKDEDPDEYTWDELAAKIKEIQGEDEWDEAEE